MDANRQYVVLLVDDDSAIREVVRDILLEELDCRVLEASNGLEAIAVLEEHEPDIILLDIEMPLQDGFSVARYIRDDPRTWHIPIIFMTGLADEQFILRAFSLGATDYVTKPASSRVLLARIKAHLHSKFIADELQTKNRMLMDRELHLSMLVDKKTQEIQRITLAMISALENANHFNDAETGHHIRRVSSYSAMLASRYGCSLDFIKKIELYASLHDVGKVGIPDKILKKPGPLTPDEFKMVEKHVLLGHQMLDTPGVDQMAKNIVLYHHERWDGNGYVHHLGGDDIPLEARIVALADVYDALSFQRIYKPCFPEDEIDRYMEIAAGAHFDPTLVDIYFHNKLSMMEIKAAQQ